MIIGILGYQGGGHLFIRPLEKLNLKYKFIKSKKDFTEDLSHIIMPGGESSVQADFIYKYGLDNVIKNLNIKIFGTCAGMILLSNYQSKLFNSLGLLDIELTRNYYGKQIASGFYQSDNQNEICFIRAPAITQINDKNIHVLDSYDGIPVLVRRDNIIAASFHPEISQNDDYKTLEMILKI